MTETNINHDLIPSDLEAFRGSSEVQPRKRQDALPAAPDDEETLVGLLVKGVLSIIAGGIVFGIVAGIVAAIIVPPWYRSLEPRYQVIWCNRLSLLCDLKPKRNEDNVYALVGDPNLAAEADSLLATNTPTPTPSLTPTIQPTAETGSLVTTIPATTSIPPSPTPPPPTNTPSPTPYPLPETTTLLLDQLHWELQNWNNCGPTTITIGLTYFGYEEDQRTAARFLKPKIEDTNVSPEQMVEFVNTVAGLPVKALYRVGGTANLLKILLANDFPVVIERGIQVEGEGWMGHYSLLVGYDDLTDEYLLYDSYLGYNQGKGRRFPQDFIEDGWQQFNYTFIVLYDPSREGFLGELLGDHANPITAASIALDIARAEATANPDDKWAWFNMGTAFTMLGNYSDAAKAYDRAFTMNLEFRMMWYQFGPYVAYYHMGRYDDVLALALASEKTTPYVEELYYYRGLVYAAQGNTTSAIFQFDKSLSYNPNFTPASSAKQAVLEGRFVAPNPN